MIFHLATKACQQKNGSSPVKGKKNVSAACAEERRWGAVHKYMLFHSLRHSFSQATHAVFVMLFLRRACCWRIEETWQIFKQLDFNPLKALIPFKLYIIRND